MSPKLRSAFCVLLLGILSVTAYYTVRDDHEPTGRAVEPEPPQPSSRKRTTDTPSFGLDRTSGFPEARRLPLSSPADPRDWSKAKVIRERTEFAEEANPSVRFLHRIVEDREILHPIHIVEAVDTDPAGGEVSSTLVSARIANQILLSSVAPLNQVEVADIAASLGWRISSQTRSPYIAILETDEADFGTVDAALEDVMASGTSLAASPNQIYYAFATPNDPRFTASSLWGLRQTNDIDIDAPEGWDIRQSASAIIVAIIDTGVRVTHEDLRSNIWMNAREATRNSRDDDGNGYTDDTHGIDTVNDDTVPNDDNGHGTHVAGILGAAGNNGKGVTGVAWDVQLMAIKSLNADGRGTTSALVEGIDYAIDNGARIINASWGGDSYDDAIDQALERARNRGILFVAAAGNDGYPYPSYPASSLSENVISVGSINRLGELSHFSNYSEMDVDVLAPGDEILSTWHDADNAYTEQSGTSMAAPYVSGILALNLVQHAGDDYSYHIRRLIASSASRETLRHFARSGGLVKLAASLQMTRVPVPPRIILSWSSAQNIDEGSEVAFHVEAESELALRYRWYHDGALLAEPSSTLTLTNAQPH